VKLQNQIKVAEGGVYMFGISDPWILSTYLLCILSAALCVVYGLANWNKGAEEERTQIAEEAAWENTAEET
jgi:hypothetical protein